MHVRIDKELVKPLKQEAKSQARSCANQVNLALRMYLLSLATKNRK